MPGTPGDARGRHNGSVNMVQPTRWFIAPAALGLEALVEAFARGDGVLGRYLLLGLVALATTLPLALPRAGVAVVIGAGALSLVIFDILTVAGFAAQLVAAYRLGRRSPPVAAIAAGAAYLPVALSVPGRIPVLLASLVPVLALAGLALRRRAEEATHHAARQAFTGTLIQHTVQSERARIAHELHDVVAHHISMVVVLAENARLAIPGMPEAGATRLSAIGDAARAALTDTRRLLGVLRDDSQDDTPERHPQPGIRQVVELLDEARDATRARTRLIFRGTPLKLDPGVELTAFRIVQEALANARRHAPGAAVDVELHYTDTALRLLIRDNGPGPAEPPTTGGHGLLGMRERAAAVGGHVRTGPANLGGFLVEATLPAAGVELP